MKYFFCGDCGSTLYKQGLAPPMAPFVLVQAGTIDGDDMTKSKPDVEVWTSRRADWIPALPGLDQKATFV